MPYSNFFSTNDYFDAQHIIYEYLTSEELFETLKILNKNQYCLAALVLFSRLEREDIMYQQAMMRDDTLLPIFQAQAQMADSGGSLIPMLEKRLLKSMHSKYSDTVHKTQVMVFIDTLHNNMQHGLSDQHLTNLYTALTSPVLIEYPRISSKRRRIDALNSLARFAPQLHSSQVNEPLLLALASAITAPDDNGPFEEPGPTSVSVVASKTSGCFSSQISPDISNKIFQDVVSVFEEENFTGGNVHQMIAKLYVIREALDEDECAWLLSQVIDRRWFNIERGLGRTLVIDVVKHAYLTYGALLNTYIQDLHEVLQSEELTKEQRSKLMMLDFTSSLLPQKEIISLVTQALERINRATLSQEQLEVTMEVLRFLSPHLHEQEHMEQVIDAILPHFLSVSWKFYCDCNEVFLLLTAKIGTKTRDKIIDVLISHTKPSGAPTQPDQESFSRQSNQELKIIRTLAEVVDEEQATKIILRYGTYYKELYFNHDISVKGYIYHQPKFDVADLYLDKVRDEVIALLLKDYIKPRDFHLFDEDVVRAANFLLHLSERLNSEQRTALCKTFLQKGFYFHRDIHQESIDTLSDLLKQPQSFDVTPLCDKAVDDYCATHSDPIEKKSSAVAFLVRFYSSLNPAQITKIVSAINQLMDSFLQLRHRDLESDHLETLLPVMMNQLPEHDKEQLTNKLIGMLSVNNHSVVDIAKKTLSACNDVLPDAAKEAVLSAVLANISQLSNDLTIMEPGGWGALSLPQLKLNALLEYLVCLNKTSAPCQAMIESNHHLIGRFLAHPDHGIYDNACKTLCGWLPNMSPHVATSTFETLLGMSQAENVSVLTKVNIMDSLMKWTIATKNTERLQQLLDILVQILIARPGVNDGIFNVTTDIQIMALRAIEAALEIATVTQQDFIFQGIVMALSHEEAGVRQSALDVLQPWLARVYQDEVLVEKLQKEIDNLPDKNLETTLLKLAIERMPGYEATHEQNEAPGL